MTFDDQVRQKGLHLRLAHFGRVAFAVEQDVSLHPVDISLLGA
jgi:hypothetical protein